MPWRGATMTGGTTAVAAGKRAFRSMAAPSHLWATLIISFLVVVSCASKTFSFKVALRPLQKEMAPHVLLWCVVRAMVNTLTIALLAAACGTLASVRDTFNEVSKAAKNLSSKLFWWILDLSAKAATDSSAACFRLSWAAESCKVVYGGTNLSLNSATTSSKTFTLLSG